MSQVHVRCQNCLEFRLQLIVSLVLLLRHAILRCDLGRDLCVDDD